MKTTARLLTNVVKIVSILPGVSCSLPSEEHCAVPAVDSSDVQPAFLASDPREWPWSEVPAQEPLGIRDPLVGYLHQAQAPAAQLQEHYPEVLAAQKAGSVLVLTSDSTLGQISGLQFVEGVWCSFLDERASCSVYW